MGQANQQLSDALKRLSAAKYGHPRGQVEQDIFKRLSVKKEAIKGSQGAVGAPVGPVSGGGSSFLDEWLAKRKQLTQNPVVPAAAAPIAAPAGPAQPFTGPPVSQLQQPSSPVSQRPPVDIVVSPTPMQQPLAARQASILPATTPVVSPEASQPKSVAEEMNAVLQAPKKPSEHLSVRGQDDKGDDEVSIKLH